MATALRGVLIGFVILWAVLLIACWRKRDFCPLLSDARRTRWLWLATFVFVNPLLTVLYLIFGQLRSPGARPVRLVRDLIPVVAIVGFFVNIPGLTHLWMQPFLGRSDGGFKAHLAVIEAKTNTSTTSAISSSDNSRFSCAKMALIVEDDHPLLQRVAAELVAHLEAIPAVKAVELLPHGAFPKSGGRTPDVFMRMSLGRIDETALPYSRTIEAQIGVHVGRIPWHSVHSYVDRNQPPLLHYNLSFDMTHVSTTTGYESVRYSLAAANIAKDLAETIATTFAQWRDKYGLLPDLSDEFYGSYVATELPEALREREPERLGSYTGLLTHNETYYRFTLTGDPVAPITAVRDAMVAAGWKELSSDLDASSLNLRLAKDARQIHIFRTQQHRPFHGEVVISTGADQEPSCLIGVVDVQRFGDDELEAVLDGLLTVPISMERLTLFERMFSRKQEDRWFEILREQPPRDVFTQLRLAEMCERREQSTEAVQALARAKTLLWAVRDDSTYKNRMKKLAKKLGDETLMDSPPAPEDFRAVGFLAVAPGKEMEVEAVANEPVTVFCFDREDQPIVSTVTVRSADNESDPFCVDYVQRQAHGSAWGSHGGFGVHGGPWQGLVNQDTQDVSVAWDILQIVGQDRFKISVTVEEH